MINIKSLMYAAEINRLGSVKKAADKLYIGQPNLSRLLIDLEEELGITLFERSPKGMKATPEGEEVFAYADKLFRQIEVIEDYCRSAGSDLKKFSVSVSPSEYITEAFTAFAASFADIHSAELSFVETDVKRVIGNVISNNCHIGIIRYESLFDSYFKEYLTEKHLSYEVIGEFPLMITVSNRSVLAGMRSVSRSKLCGMTEIKLNDRFVPSLTEMRVRKETELTEKEIVVTNISTQLELVSADTNSFMLSPPLTEQRLEMYGLVQVYDTDIMREVKDILIKNENHSLTELDSLFIDELMRAKRKYRSGLSILI